MIGPCRNCGAGPGEECRHDLGCIDQDRRSLESATSPLGDATPGGGGVAVSSEGLSTSHGAAERFVDLTGLSLSSRSGGEPEVLPTNAASVSGAGTVLPLRDPRLAWPERAA